MVSKINIRSIQIIMVLIYYISRRTNILSYIFGENVDFSEELNLLSCN